MAALMQSEYGQAKQMANWSPYTDNGGYNNLNHKVRNKNVPD